MIIKKIIMITIAMQASSIHADLVSDIINATNRLSTLQDNLRPYVARTPFITPPPANLPQVPITVTNNARIRAITDKYSADLINAKIESDLIIAQQNARYRAFTDKFNIDSSTANTELNQKNAQKNARARAITDKFAIDLAKAQ